MAKVKKTYTYPELIKKYFPGDPTTPGKVTSDSETTVIRDAFFDVVKKISKPTENKPRRG